MTTVISGTNRKDSKTSIVAQAVHTTLKQLNEEVNLVDLNKVDVNIENSHIYHAELVSEELRQIQDDFLIPSDKIVIVSPEYNGSFPGYLKYFLDAVSVRKYKETFSGKKCYLIGVAGGRAGNLRGIDHLSAILNHVGAVLMPGSLPLSSINSLINEKLEINSDTSDLIKSKLEQFMEF